MPSVFCGNMLRAVYMSERYMSRLSSMAAMAIARTPCTGFTTLVPESSAVSMAAASVSLAATSMPIASWPAAALTTLSSLPSSQTSSSAASLEKLMLNNYMLMPLHKATQRAHFFDSISNQRWYSTSTDSFLECAEKKQDPVLKTLDSSTDLSIESKKLVVVVESLAKAMNIQQYLGPDHIVLPSYGHIRDLAPRAGSVRPDDDYAMVWEVPEVAQPHITRIKDALKGAKCLVLATDPDSEGEALAWHVYMVMKAEGLLRNNNVKVVRVVFNEITRNAVLQAMKAPRKITTTLVNAYLAQRALDYLISFTLSPLLWRKLPGSLSLGHVQLTALRLVCDREKAADEFLSQKYWTVKLSAHCERSTQESTLLPLQLTYLDGQKVEQFSLSYDSAILLAKKLDSASVKVSAITKGSKQMSPPEPYTSSTLQQDAQAKLGFGSLQTMNLAQKLYEGVDLGNEGLTGLITYMHTDEHQFSKEAVGDIRGLVSQRYGRDFLSPIVREFGSKVKKSQVFQEAIRPTNMQRIPSTLCHTLEKDALALYTLIWRRTIESQMVQALYEEVAVDFTTEDGAVCLQATGSHLVFPGFLAATKDRQASLDFEVDSVLNFLKCEDLTSESWAKVSALKEGDIVLIRKSYAQEYFTDRPARYSEGLLIKAMDELGIGRPSTYASIVQTLQARNYVKIEDHHIIPEVRGRMATIFLSHYFPGFTDYNFTAYLEKQLEEVSRGQLPWKKVLGDFWSPFYADVSSVMKLSTNKVIDVLHDVFLTQCCTAVGVKGFFCPRCGNGHLTLKLGRYGSGIFLACNNHHFCSFKVRVIGIEGGTESSSVEEASKFQPINSSADVLLGKDPVTNFEVRVKEGPFGLYIQLGEEGRGMRLSRVPRGVELADITLDKAIKLMQYPLNLGNHPEDGHAVTLNLKESFYVVRHGSISAVVPKSENVEDMTLERALELLKSRNVTRLGRKSFAAHAVTEQARKLKQEKIKEKLRQRFNMPVNTVESESRKVAANAKSKKSTMQNSAKLVGRKKVDCVGVGGAAAGDGECEDIQGKDGGFTIEAKSTT